MRGGSNRSQVRGCRPATGRWCRARLAQTFGALDLPDEANAHRVLASAAWHAHRAVQADLVGWLAGLSAPVPAPRLQRLIREPGPSGERQNTTMLNRRR